MSGRHSRNKGSQFERDVAKIFREHLGLSAEEIKRGIGQSRNSAEVADVDGVPGLWIEAKRHKKTYPKKALEQARIALEASKKNGQIPIAVCRDDFAVEATVTLYLKDFLNIAFPKKVS